jgi:TatD DNase family protein
MSSLFDTHAHLHDEVFTLDKNESLKKATLAGVDKIISIGTDARLSNLAIEFAKEHPNVWASVGLHPHEAKHLKSQKIELEQLIKKEKVVAIGECGIDYFYNHSNRDEQFLALRTQLDWASKTSLPVVLHVRSSQDNPKDAFTDLWKIWDGFDNLRGVVHSFSSTLENMQSALDRGLYIAINGIMTFSNDPEHYEVIKKIPLNKMLLESDAPFLTPLPNRGKINEPKYVRDTANYIAEVRKINIEDLANATTANAENLFLNK